MLELLQRLPIAYVTQMPDFISAGKELGKPGRVVVVRVCNDGDAHGGWGERTQIPGRLTIDTKERASYLTAGFLQRIPRCASSVRNSADVLSPWCQ